MKVVLLSSQLGNDLKFLPDDEIIYTDPYATMDHISDNTDFIISYGYRRIIKGTDLSRFKGKIINIHMSLLPWNRGAYPNYWSWRDRTPKGVTIHEINDGIDTGPILAQMELPLKASEYTLRTSYDALHVAAIQLFSVAWPLIRCGKIEGRRQVTLQGVRGSYHASAQSNLPPMDTPCELIESWKA